MNSIQIGQRLNVVIEKISQGGDGIARLKSHSPAPLPPHQNFWCGGESSPLMGEERNFVIFVPYSLPDEELEIQVIEKRKNFARGLITKIIKSSPERIAPPCPYFFNSADLAHSKISFQNKNIIFSPSPQPSPLKEEDKSGWCGGCDFQHLNYGFQLEQKTKVFKETLEKIGGIPSGGVLSAMGMNKGEGGWRYRNKIQVPFGKDKKNQRTIAGFYAPGSHEIVSIEDCLIHSEKMMNLVNFVCRKMNEWKIEPYSDKSHRGWLRHFFTREEKSEGKMIVVFVTAKEFFPRQNDWIREIRNQFPDVAGILQNVNSVKTNVILGRKWKRIYGQDYLIEEMRGLGQSNSSLSLKVSASSFFQVNTLMAEILYKTVRDFALEKFDTSFSYKNDMKRNILLDLYCGVGGIALSCAPYFQKVVGIDETFSSIQDAKENVKINQIRNCEFHRSDVYNFLRSFSLVTSHRSPMAVVLDPPRSGCDPKVLEQILKLKPQKIVYVSCDPSTLARDLKILCGNNAVTLSKANGSLFNNQNQILRYAQNDKKIKYEIKKIQPVDMFPQTSHLESVSLLIKTDSSSSSLLKKEG